MRPRAIAKLAPVLTRLHLVGAISLPPDWRQLTRLRELQVENEEDWAAEGNNWREEDEDGDDWGWFEWGTDSLAPLAALERISLSCRGVLPGELPPMR